MVFDSNSCRHLHKSLQKYINERAAEETIVKRACDASWLQYFHTFGSFILCTL